MSSDTNENSGINFLAIVIAGILVVGAFFIAVDYLSSSDQSDSLNLTLPDGITISEEN